MAVVITRTLDRRTNRTVEPNFSYTEEDRFTQSRLDVLDHTILWRDESSNLQHIKVRQG